MIENKDINFKKNVKILEWLEMKKRRGSFIYELEKSEKQTIHENN